MRGFHESPLPVYLKQSLSFKDNIRENEEARAKHDHRQLGLAKITRGKVRSLIANNIYVVFMHSIEYEGSFKCGERQSQRQFYVLQEIIDIVNTILDIKAT